MTSTTTHNVHKFYRVARAAKARAGPRSFFRQLLDNWLSQGAIARLAQLDDAVLRDAGITRRDIEWASKLPITVNAEKALIDRVNSR